MSSSVKVLRAFEFLWSDKADDGLPVRFRAVRGGRGSGKSHAFATALLAKAGDITKPPLRILCAREIQKSIKDSVKRLLDDKIRELGIGDFYESTETEIRGKNGSLFLFYGLRTNPESVKSAEGIDIAAIFEADRVSQHSLDLLIPTIRKDGSEIWAEWNPNLPTDPIDQLFCGEDGPPPGSIVRKVNWDLNEFFPEVLRRDMEWDRTRDYEKYRHVWEGEYRRNTEAQVFKNWKVEEFDSDPGAVYRQGADWGFSVDPSVLVRCYAKGRQLFIDHEAYAVGVEIDRLPDLFMGVPDAEKWWTVADSSRPETISYMKRHGFPRINSAVKGKNSVEEGVEFLKSFDIVVHPRCRHTIDELSNYSYEVDKLTGAVLPRLADRENHVIDALRYATEPIRRAMKPERAVEPVRTQHVEHGWMG